MVWVPLSWHLDLDGQRSRYLSHNNTIEDAGYLAQFARPMELLRRYSPEARRVLDYGSGPSPVFVELLRRAGYEAVGYDSLFSPDADLSQRFDAIVSIETFEHFSDPRSEIGKIGGLLKPGGCLVVMTHLHRGLESIADWWYARDVTHVSFYSGETFDWICGAFGFTLIDKLEATIRVLRRD